jgi:hypothetical protein
MWVPKGKIKIKSQIKIMTRGLPIYTRYRVHGSKARNSIWGNSLPGGEG